MLNAERVDVANRTFLANYLPAPIVMESGVGCRLTDVEGREYLDLCGGIAVVNVGHGHPKLAAAVASQAGRLMHVSNLFFNERSIELAQALSNKTGFERLFFCNSGAEANEALLKLARRYHYDQGASERRKIVTMLGSFHGRTMGALSLTGQPKYHEGVGPMVGEVEHVPFGDLEALTAAVDERTAAVLLEPIQGEGGIVVPDPAYLSAVRQLCDERGALLFFDEVQTGIGRTGRFLAAEWSGVRADGCSLAKGIGSGFPLGAIAVSERLVNGLPPGTHATTYGGNPLACAAALAVLEILEEEELVERAEARGQFLATALQTLVDDDSITCAEAVRGRGLLQGLVLGPGVSPGDVLRAVREAGVLLSLAGGNVLRFTPPLCVSEDELLEGVRVVRAVLRST